MTRAPGRTPFHRATALRRLGKERFDVLVIGGGITGAGVALDAAARGMRTALVEGRDFASGTSSQSSKLIHGGLRYLQQKDFALVYEALAERQRLLGNAPHLVTRLPFLIPLFGNDGVIHQGIARTYSSALWLYDLTGGLRIGERHRRLSGPQALADFPALDTRRLIAGFRYWDAWADDARLSLTIARTAVSRYGAVAANYAPVVALRTDECQRVCGATLDDGTEIKATTVVNACGVWSDQLRALDTNETGGASLRPAKGIHLTFRADRLPTVTAAVLPVPGDRRTIFVVPWGDFTYVGTTDTDYDGSLETPQCTPEDVAYLLRALNAAITAPVSEADVVGSWAGLRPLVREARNARTADLSRRHQVSVSTDGMINVTGGKLTTYRRMAADAVDEVARQLGGSRRRSPTKHLLLLGADRAAALRKPGSASRLGVTEEVLAHLVNRYGSEARTVIAMMEADPQLGRPLLDGLPYLRAEAVYAARYEMAWTLDDVLSRRTRARLLDRDATAEAAADVARLIAPELGWSPARADTEVEAYRDMARRAKEAMSRRDAPDATEAARVGESRTPEPVTRRGLLDGAGPARDRR
ncbi:MAG TPA: glycerol-3-phosphate dehydrogenase/oxidase [Acidimicrobiales bacterium]